MEERQYPAKHVVPSKLHHLIDRLGAENLGDYLEFGVFSGTSISCMYQVLQEFNLPQVRLFGFDSFEGMPESSATEDEGTWEPGQFKFGIEYTKGILTARGIDWNRVLLTKGWFCNTLTPEFRQQRVTWRKNSKASPPA